MVLTVRVAAHGAAFRRAAVRCSPSDRVVRLRVGAPGGTSRSTSYRCGCCSVRTAGACANDRSSTDPDCWVSSSSPRRTPSRRAVSVRSGGATVCGARTHGAFASHAAHGPAVDVPRMLALVGVGFLIGAADCTTDAK